MKNLLQTHSVSWAQSVKIALEAEGIAAAVLDHHSLALIAVGWRADQEHDGTT